MPNDQDYFSRDRHFLHQVRKELQGDIKTIADLKQRALCYRWRGAGCLIAEKIDRLTQRKVKPDGSRDGRWVWQNRKALMGRRLNEEHPLNLKVLYALQALIVHDYEPGEFWGLLRDWRARLHFGKKLKPNDSARNALDVLTILCELQRDAEALPE